MSETRIGWAQVSITPDRPAFLMGQIYWRVSKYVHDPITATALVIENGREQVLFLSMDTVFVPQESVMKRVREQLAQVHGMQSEKLIVNATHTHNSIGTRCIGHSDWGVLLGVDPACLQPELEVPSNVMRMEEIEDFLVERMTDVLVRAWNVRQPGGISGASDYAAVAFNRRPMFRTSNGEISRMYGDCSHKDFIGFESGSDHSVEMLYTWSSEGTLTGVLICVPCPSQVFELHHFISADYWGYTREALRDKLGNLFVLPLCGPAGDQNPIDLVRISKDNAKELAQWNAQAGEVWRNLDMADACRDIGERISDAVIRGCRKARNRIDTNPILRRMDRTIELPLRKVTASDYQEAVSCARALVVPFVTGERRVCGKDQVALFEPIGIIARWRQQQMCEFVSCNVHAVRIGNAVLATNPFELFHEYGLRIKARARARQTILVQLADGGLGYLPTEQAIAGGSYSSKPASTQCDHIGGDRLVEETIEMMDALMI